MKRSIVFALATLLIFSSLLVACGAPSTNENDEPTSKTEALEFPEAPSEGFKFSQIDDNSCVITGIGTCTDTMVRIPSELGGMKVVAVSGGFDWKRSSGEPIKGLMFPDTVTEIKSTDRSYCFSNSLEKIVLPNTPMLIDAQVFTGTPYWLDSSNWTDGALYIGQHLIAVNSDVGDTFSVRKGTLDIASHTFFECEVIHVIIPSSVVNISDEAFMHCEGMNRLTIGSGVTYIGENALYNCDTLKITAYAGSETDWKNIQKSGFRGGSTPTDYEVIFNWTDMDGENNIEVGTTDPKYFTFTINPDNASYKAKVNTDYIGMVTEYHIPSEYNGLPVTSVGSFGGLKNVTTITMPDSVTSVDYFAFGTNPDLTTLKLSSSLTVLPEKLCSGCEKLNHVTIPASVTRIETDAFGSCVALNDIRFAGTVSQWGSVSRGEWWCSGIGDSYPTEHVTCKDGLGAVVSKELTSSEWNNAVRYDNFKNVTLNISAEFLEGIDEGNTSFDGTVKIAGDVIKLFGELLNDSREIGAYKELYIGCIYDLVKDLDKFEYDSATARYISKGAISYSAALDLPMYGYTAEADITATDVKIEFDDRKQNIEKITLKMTQNVYEYGDPRPTLVLNAVLTLSDYGTTTMQ